MKIIGGTYRNTKLVAFDEMTIRPTKAIVKEALFNIIGPNIQKADFLDLFTGSGSVAFEAVSRGANVYACDQIYYDVIKKNEAKLNVKLNFTKSDALVYLQSSQMQYDYIFLDPPYNIDFAYLNKIIETIKNEQKLKMKGRIFIELNNENKLEHEIQKVYKYGKSKIIELKMC